MVATPAAHVVAAAAKKLAFLLKKNTSHCVHEGTVGDAHADSRVEGSCWPLLCRAIISNDAAEENIKHATNVAMSATSNRFQQS
jgi:hypothetical protein